ncbi:hypothetical protein [Gordonia liuliyuniae]|uniref:Uncharacterized protein n=1 Tax=Gordonia liuliyuniae TaxID=2911517 RepID=A0ABS9IWA0_9ACTN|nr:hypothetical protein [Gordonia liuliyuniae]MCF8589848.1 hypothetical protein [Gordonia liuliyuniae]
MTLSDAQLVDVVDRTVGAVDGVLRLLADTDPLHLKQRGERDCRVSGVGSWALDAAHWPGTDSWDGLDVDDRAAWWVNRVGALTTAAAAFPGVFGVWSRMLPLGAWLGYAGQALVLRAVAREHGATSRAVGVVMLADILFDRDVSETVVGVDDEKPHAGDDAEGGLVEQTWGIGTTIYELSKSLDSRPSMPRAIGWGTWIPFLGGPLTYIGERIALHRAVGQATAWIDAHPGVVTRASS